MSLLVLELRPGEMMVVNGATIRFRSRCRVELISKARFLFGKQVMAAHEANTAIGELYYALQRAYAGPQEERADAMRIVQALLDTLGQDGPPDRHAALERVRARIAQDDHYDALKTLRALHRQERSAGLPMPESV